MTECLNPRHKNKRKIETGYCSTCWWNSSPERVKQAAQAHYKCRYGISLEEYNKLVEVQKGVCAICKKASTKLCVDHDHTTGKVRGLLCRKCNVVLGQAEDNPETLSNAISYLFKRSN